MRRVKRPLHIDTICTPLLAVRPIQMNAWPTRLFGDLDSRSVVRIATIGNSMERRARNPNTTRRSQEPVCDSHRCLSRFGGAVMLNVTAVRTASGEPSRSSHRVGRWSCRCIRRRSQKWVMVIHSHGLYKSLRWSINVRVHLAHTCVWHCTMRASAASSVFHFEQLVVFPATGIHATPDVISAAA